MSCTGGLYPKESLSSSAVPRQVPGRLVSALSLHSPVSALGQSEFVLLTLLGGTTNTPTKHTTTITNHEKTNHHRHRVHGGGIHLHGMPPHVQGSRTARQATPIHASCYTRNQKGVPVGRLHEDSIHHRHRAEVSDRRNLPRRGHLHSANPQECDSLSWQHRRSRPRRYR